MQARSAASINTEDPRRARVRIDRLRASDSSSLADTVSLNKDATKSSEDEGVSGNIQAVASRDTLLRRMKDERASGHNPK